MTFSLLFPILFPLLAALGICCKTIRRTLRRLHHYVLAAALLAWLSVIGFAAVIFTLFGVSYLLPGMHSYLTPGN